MEDVFKQRFKGSYPARKTVSAEFVVGRHRWA
jgi:hypothetical protein